MGVYIKDGCKLFDYQLQNVRGMVKTRRCLLVDSTGNGKSLCALWAFSFLLSKSLARNLVIFVPRNGYVKEVWQKDCAKFLNSKFISLDDLMSAVKTGVSLQGIMEKYPIIVCKHTHCKTSYDALFSLYKANDKILTVIDEVQACKNPRAELTKSMRSLLKLSYGVWGLTATPLSKNCMDTYNILNFIYPKVLGTVKDFQSRFCKINRKVIGKDADGNLTYANEIVDFKDIADFQNYLKGILIIGAASVSLQSHFVDFTLSDAEMSLYRRVANGLSLRGSESDDDQSWLKTVLTGSGLTVGLPTSIRSIKELSRYSSRFIYLQSVVDGSLNADGTFGVSISSKSKRLLELCSEIASRGESALIYCDYYTTVDNLLYILQHSGIKDCKGNPIRIAEQSSRNGFKSGVVSESLCKANSYFVLCTPGASESENYYYLNNVIMYDIPVTPKTYLQMVGRITRRSTLFPDNLHAWVFRSDTIDLYKLYLVGFKMYMQSAASPDIKNFPAEYIKSITSADQFTIAKRHLLWCNRSKSISTLF